jgi:hypothetical protein
MQPDFSDSLIVQYLGEGFRGRRYLRYADLHSLGLVSNRDSLKDWVDRGAFPAGVKIAGNYGTTLLWSAAEVAEHIANCFAERERSSRSFDASQEKGASQEAARLLDSSTTGPVPTGRRNTRATIACAAGSSSGTCGYDRSDGRPAPMSAKSLQTQGNGRV